MLLRLTVPLLGVLALTACSSAAPTDSPSRTAADDASTAPSATASSSAVPGTSEVTTLRFTSSSTSVDVRIDGDNPTARALVEQAPFETTLREFNGREKIGDPPAPLPTDGSPGSDPEDGDLIYFVPWGNLGFYYDTSGIGYSDDTIHLGTYDASEATLSALEGTVRVTVVR